MKYFYLFLDLQTFLTASSAVQSVQSSAIFIFQFSAPGSLPVGSECRPQGKALPMMATTTADFRQILPKNIEANKVRPSVSLTPSASLRPMQVNFSLEENKFVSNTE